MSRRSVEEGGQATLDGSGSSDPESGTLDYLWQQERGPDVVLRGSQTTEATFIAPAVVREARLVFRLTVTDAGGLTDEGTVEVVVTDTPPMADAGDDRRATSGDEVRLEGRGADTPGSGFLTYRWEQEVGPDVRIELSDEAEAVFTAPTVDEEIRLVFRLTVTNAGGLTSQDTVRVIVEPASEPTTAPTDEPPSVPANQAPVAMFTVTPTSGHHPLEITLDGTGSHDPDGTIDWYNWEFETVPSSNNPFGFRRDDGGFRYTFEAVGTYQVWLRVRDNDRAESRSAPRTIVVAPPDANLPPQGLSITVEKVYNVPLTYRFSAEASDVDGHVVDYEWRFLSGGEDIPVMSGRKVEHSFGHRNSILYDWRFVVEGNRRLEVYLTVTDNEGATTELLEVIRLGYDHIFAGQQHLLDRLETAGGPFGMLFLGDGAADDPESHGHDMYRMIRQMSIPPENIAMHETISFPYILVFQGRPAAYLVDDLDGMLRQGFLVGTVPYYNPFSSERDIEAIDVLNMVWVTATSNTGLHQECPDNGLGVDWRDVWNPNHPYWDSCYRSEIDRVAGFPESYHGMLASLATGKVLIAGSAMIRADGTVEPNLTTVMCGDLKEYCFSVPSVHTGSRATVVLGALMYLFMQMYDDPATAVAALKNCTRDVGEPGVDREFGQGIVDLRFCSEAQLPIIDRDPSPNQPPVARITRMGGDIVSVDGDMVIRAVEGDMITLDGSASSDPNGDDDELFYHWQQAPYVDVQYIHLPGIAATEVTLKARVVQDPTTRRDKITIERIRLFVTDEHGRGLTDYDEVTIEVRPR